jgi:hypothetical protein
MILKSIAAFLLCGTVLGATAQQQTAPAPSAPTPSNPNAKVLFSRSDDQNTDQNNGPATPQNTTAHANTQNATEKITDAERRAVTFTAYNLDVHLAPRDHAISARAQLKIRNDGTQPLTILPLQLSSSLNFEDAGLNGQRLSFTQQDLNSDTDHTGQLHEAVIQLPAPLAPRATLNIDVVYSGSIEVDAHRLQELGTPDDTAAHSDWDRISEDFTGLRGFGNVVWYPVASIPALLGDGDKVFAEIGAQKQRQSHATIALRLTVEYYLAPPSVIVFNGHAIPAPKPSVMPTLSYPGIVTAQFSAANLGFATPSLFLAGGTPVEGNGLRIYTRGEDQANAQSLMTAATIVQPTVSQWLGAKQKSQVTIIDLPEAQDLGWEQDTLLLTAVTNQPPESYTEMIAHALSHAAFQSPREWLDEGVPTFVETLWIEHTADRTHALERLESQRSALALAEPGSPGDAPGETLLQASNPIYYRTKATYVLWMLRDLAGEKELAAALQAYDPAADTTPDYFQKLVEQSSHKDLQWFFDNWVYNDRGLPDLSIVAFHASPAEFNGQFIAAIDILNDGYAETEVPVTVRSQSGTLTERVLLPAKTRTVHRMLVQGQPQQVIVNDGTVPEVAADIHQRDIADH